MHTIYYIEDDAEIAAQISAYLHNKNCHVVTYSSVTEAKAALDTRLPSLCLIDWNLPDGTGEQLVVWIRQHWVELPVIFITVKDQIHDIVKGFHIGADDYITKPFELEILYSRINALLRRTGVAQDYLVCGPITLDIEKNKVLLGNEEVTLSAMEYQVLKVLLENKNRTLTRAKLLEIIWDKNGNYVNDNTLTVTMKRMREKLKNPECIKTIRSFGYRIEER